ncbi:MAG: FtsX-like permease family protein [Microbacterium sp.]|nr:FtsX-like permease family protein [Microbacterium sp.]
MTATLDGPAVAPPRGAARTARGLRARWRVAARLARRQVRRTLLSSALIATLILLPIAAMTGYAVIALSSIPTVEERIAMELGRTQSWISVAGLPGNGFWQAPTQPSWNGYPSTMSEMPTGTAVTDPTTLLPAGTSAISVTQGTVRVTTPDGVTGMQATAGETWDPSLAGSYDLLDGRAPAGPHDALVTPATLNRLGIGIGDEITLPDSGSRYTVTGTMRSARLGDAVPALFLPPSAAVRGDRGWYLPDHALSWADVKDLNEQGVVALSRTVLLDPPDVRGTDAEFSYDEYWASRWSIMMVLAMAALFTAYVVVMLAGAAFAVAARRQQRSLAVAASVGASASDLRRVILLQGTTLGLVGGVMGVALGIGAAAVVMHLVGDGTAPHFPGFHPPWEILAVILLFAVLVGTASAAMPARTVGRSDTLSALRGARRPQVPTASRPLWGSLLMVVGLAVTLGSAATIVAIADTDIAWDSPLRTIPPFGIVVGPIVVQAGILLSGRWLLWMTARLLSPLGLAARLASRDAAANSSRTVPAFAAIAATVFLGVFALSTAAMQNADTAREWYYQAPVGGMAVSFAPTGTGFVTELDADQRRDAAEAALELADAAGATRTAVVQKQPSSWAYADVSTLPEDQVHVLAILPERYLLEPQESFRSRGQDPGNPLSVISADEIETALGVTLTPEQLQAYRSGAAIVADPRFAVGGAVELAAWTPEEASRGEIPSNIWPEPADGPGWATPTWDRRIDAIVLDLPFQPTAVAIAPETAADLRIAVNPEFVVSGFDAPVGVDVRDRTGLLSETLSTEKWTIYATWENGPPDDALWMIPIIVAVATLVLGASAVALSLARFERRPDDATLSAVGGTGGMRRRIGFWQGLIIAGFGTLAGAAAGILPPIGLAIQSGGSMRLHDAPWVVLLGLAVALPLGIAAVSWLVTPRRPDLTRRTAIT